MADEAKPSWLKSMAENVTAITTIGTFFIGLPALFYTINDQANQRAKAFSEAVSHEEARIDKIYQLLYSALEDYSTTEKSASAKAKFKAVCILIDRKPANLSYFPLGLVRQKTDTLQHQFAKKQLEDLSNGIQNIIEDPDVSPTDISTCKRAIENIEAEKATKRPRAEQDQTVSAAAAPAVTQNAQAQTVAEVTAVPALGRPALDPATQPASVTLSAGVANGWDIDVFWCEGGNERTNLDQASTAAQRLVSSGVKGLLIGRVRLRLISLSRQRDAGYRPLNFEVRGEAGERSAADALVAALSRPGAPYRYRPSTQVTKWYLSAFVCQP